MLEIGYRERPSKVPSYSISAFRHNHEKLRSGLPPPAFVENRIEGFENGVEGLSTFQAARAWRVSGGFSILRQHLGIEPGCREPTGPIAPGNEPGVQWLRRSSHNSRRGRESDVAMRRVASLPAQASAFPVPADTAVDGRWGWRATRNAEVSLTPKNIFDRRHAERKTPFAIDRAIFFHSGRVYGVPIVHRACPARES